MWRTWLIIVLMVLAPLRGWAWSAMSVEPLRSAPQTAFASHHAGDAASVMPAHAACHDAEQATVHPDESGAHAGSAPCAHCDVCHAVMAPPSLSLGLTMQAPAESWGAIVMLPATPQLASRLFRPPRV